MKWYIYIKICVYIYICIYIYTQFLFYSIVKGIKCPSSHLWSYRNHRDLVARFEVQVDPSPLQMTFRQPLVVIRTPGIERQPEGNPPKDRKGKHQDVMDDIQLGFPGFPLFYLYIYICIYIYTYLRLLQSLHQSYSANQPKMPRATHTHSIDGTATVQFIWT